MSSRKRRSNRCVQPDRPNQTVVMFAFTRDLVANWQRWWYRSVSLREAERMVERGLAEALLIVTDNGPTRFFRETVAPALTPEQTRNLYRSPTTLTLATIKAVSIAEPGTRLSRAERAQVEKFMVWPLVGDRRNLAAVRPRMSAADRQRATNLLQQGLRPATAGHCCRPARHDVRTWYGEAGDPAPVAA